MKNLYLSLLLLIPLIGMGQETYYLKADFSRTAIKDSASLICTIGELDATTKAYPFKQVFNTGEVYKTGSTTNAKSIVQDVETTEYYITGKPLSATIYQETRPVKISTYYPNGQLYLVQQFEYNIPDPSKPKEINRRELILTCNDEDGKPLTQNGNGTFKNYFTPVNPKFNRDPEGSYTYETGSITNGFRNGTWIGSNATAGFSYTEEYDNGRFIKGHAIDKDQKTYDYNVLEKAAEFPGGLDGFYRFIEKECRYPLSAKFKFIQGKVFVSFVVNKDGSLSDIKVLRSPDGSLSQEAIRVVQRSPRWKAGEQHGMLVRQRYAVPISFTLK